MTTVRELKTPPPGISVPPVMFPPNYNPPAVLPSDSTDDEDEEEQG